MFEFIRFSFIYHYLGRVTLFIIKYKTFKINKHINIYS